MEPRAPGGRARLPARTERRRRSARRRRALRLEQCHDGGEFEQQTDDQAPLAETPGRGTMLPFRGGASERQS